MRKGRERMHLGIALPFAQELLAFLRKISGVTRVSMAGSLRRMKETIGDLDLLAASRTPSKVMQAWCAAPFCTRVLASGITKSSILAPDGMQREEVDVYRTLGLPWIPPELREDSGEIDAALAGRLPALVEPEDVRGDFHIHTRWSDGSDELNEMAIGLGVARRAWAEPKDLLNCLTLNHLLRWIAKKRIGS